MSLLKLKRRKFLLLLTLIVLFAIPAAVNARILSCRSDPVVILSNGTILDLSAEISTLLINVEEIHYELHIPVGVSAVAWIHTPAWLTSQETFTIIADQPPGVYEAYTIGRTRSGRATVTAYLTLLTATQIKLDFASASGPEDFPVFLRVQH